MDQPQKQIKNKLFSIKVNGVQVVVENNLIVTLFLNVFHPEENEIFDYFTGGTDLTKCKHNQTMVDEILKLEKVDFSEITYIVSDDACLSLIYKAVKHSDVKALKILMKNFKEKRLYISSGKYSCSSTTDLSELENSIEKHHYEDFLWNGKFYTPLEMATRMKNPEMIDLLT